MGLFCEARDRRSEVGDQKSKFPDTGYREPDTVFMPAIAVRVARTRAQAEEWALVLEAEGLSPSLERTSRGFAVSVPSEVAQRAAVALEAYETENRVTPDAEVEWRCQKGWTSQR